MNREDCCREHGECCGGENAGGDDCRRTERHGLGEAHCREGHHGADGACRNETGKDKGGCCGRHD